MREDATRESKNKKFTKNVIFPLQIGTADFDTFVWLAATELAQERVLYAEINKEKYLIAYSVARDKQKIPGSIVVYDDICAIIVTRVDKFKKFIRFDPFDDDQLKYENKFDNKITYKETVIFMRVEILQTETDSLAIEHLMKTQKRIEILMPK